MRPILLLSALILCSGLASAEGAFNLEWTDIFPMCALDSGDYNLVRCGCEFMIPNFHLGFMYDMVSNMVTSFFMLEGLYDFVIGFYSDPVGAIKGLVGGFLDTVADFFLIGGDEDRTSLEVLSDIFNGIIGWIYAIVTPFIMIILLLFIEFIKTYLFLAIPLNLWLFAMREINLVSQNENPLSSAYLAVITVILILIGTIWLIGSDIGLYQPLVIW